MKIIHVNQITEKEFEEEFIHKAIEVGIRGEYITLYRKNKELILSRLKKLNKGKLSIIREGTKDYNEIYLKRKFLFKVDSKKEESNKLNFESSSTLFDSKSISCGDLLNYTNTCQEGSGTIETECYEMLELDLKGISAIHDNSISNYQTVLESQSSEKICDFMEKLNEDKFEMNNPIQTNFFDEFDQLILDSIRSKYYGVENDYEEVNMDYSDFQI